MTKGELIAAMADLPEDTHLEIHVPAGTADTVDSDFEIGAVGQVAGADSPPWFNIAVGDFITNCGS